MKSTKLIDSATFGRTVNRLAHEVVEGNRGGENLAMVGIRTRGEHLARRLAAKIKEIEGTEPPLGILDITLYRDDLRNRLNQPTLHSTNILFDISGKTIVLVDDVLYTGRTVRSALNALMDLGRPSRILLLAFIDRGHRELPIKADIVGKNVPTSLDQEIKVMMKEVDGEDGVLIIEHEEQEVTP